MRDMQPENIHRRKKSNTWREELTIKDNATHAMETCKVTHTMKINPRGDSLC